MQKCYTLTLSEGDKTGERAPKAIMKWSVIRTYSDYASENRTRIRRFNIKNSPARATRHFAVPERQKQQQEDSH